MAARYVHCGGLRLFCRSNGRGQPLLMLHGFTGSGADLAPLARGVGTGYRVLRPDLVGHGASETPTDGAAYGMQACVAQLIELLDALGIDRVHLLGYSMGGRVALSVAAHHPERVGSVLVVGASAGLTDPAARAARRAADAALALRLRRGELEGFVDDWMRQRLFASQQCLGPDRLRRARARRLRNDPAALAASLEGMGTGSMPPLSALLRGSAVPLLLVAGALDPKFSALAHELAALWPSARARVVPGAGHAVHLEQPAALLALAREFLPPGPGGALPRRRRGAFPGAVAPTQ